MPAGDIFTTEIVTPRDRVIILGRIALPGQCAIQVTEVVIVGIPAILKIIVAMTGTPALRILAMEAEIVIIFGNARMALALVIGTCTIVLIRVIRVAMLVHIAVLVTSMGVVLEGELATNRFGQM